MKNWKGVLTILLMSVLSLGFSLSAFAAETEALQLKSKSAVLMDEKLMDVVTAVSGSSPAYVFMFIKLMIKDFLVMKMI